MAEVKEASSTALSPQTASSSTSRLTAESHRTREYPRLAEVGQPFPDSPDGSHCSAAAFRRFDVLEGRWSGTLRLADGTEHGASLVAARVQNGCSVLGLFCSSGHVGTGAAGEHKIFHAWTWGSRSELWFELRLDNRHGTLHQYRVGTEDDGGRLMLERNDDLAIVDERTPPDNDPLRPSMPVERSVWMSVSAEALVIR